MLLLFASDAAAAAGMNRYVTPQEVLERVYGYNHDAVEIPSTEVERALTAAPPAATEQVVRELKVEPQVAALDEAIAAAPTPAARQELVERRPADVVKVAAKAVQREILKTAEAPAVPESKRRVERVVAAMPEAVAEPVRRDAQVAWGVRRELGSLDLLERKLGKRIVHRNDRVLYLTLRVHSGGFVKLCGRTDGTVEGTDVLVESKERRNRLFDRVPLYEQVQLQVYLRASGGSKKIVHSQCHDGEVRYTEHGLDEALWTRFKVGLDNFVLLYEDYCREQA